MESQALTNPKGEVVAHYCSKCGLIYTPRADGTLEKARHLAEQCCAPYHCDMCGVETERYRLRCRECQLKFWFENAQKITPAEYKGQMVFSEHISSSNEGYWDLDDLETHCEDEGIPLPPFVFACDEIVWDGLDVDRAIESDMENHHEDAVDKVRDLDELRAFVTEWNKKQSISSFEPNYKIAIVLGAPVAV